MLGFERNYLGTAEFIKYIMQRQQNFKNKRSEHYCVNR